MTSLESALDQLAEARATYKAFIEAVDEDLRAERARRIETRRAEIESKVLWAYALGANIASLKRAWGTKDYRTIKNIIDSRESELDVIREEIDRIPVDPKTQTRYDWIEIAGDKIVVADFEYEVIKFDDDSGYMLSGDGPEDGKLYDPLSTGDDAAIYETLKKGWQ